MRKRIAAFAALMILIAALGFGQVQKVRLWDTDLSHSLLFQWNENDVAARILNFYVAANTRAFHITGDTYVEQDYRISASPTFLSLYLTSSTTSPFLKITNASDDEYDPIVQYAVGADPVIRWTHGLDDSLENDFILSTGATLTTTAITETYVLDVDYDDYLFVTDGGNNRIKRHMRGDLSYSAKIGTSGSGDDQFNSPRSIASNGTHVYVADMSNHRIKKHLISDLSYVAKIGSLGSGNDNFNNPKGIATDGIWLYIADYGNDRVQKRLASDLSYITEANGNGITDPIAVCTDGTYVYMVQNPGASYRIYKFLAADMSLVLRVMPAGVDGQLDNCSIQSVCTTGDYLYMTNSNSIGTGGIKTVYKYSCDDLTYVTKFGEAGTGDGQFTAAYGIATDETYLYVSDISSGGWDPQRIQKLLLDGTFVAKFGTYGNGDDNFYGIYGLSVSGVIDILVEVPAGGPIFRADHNATWFDVYPLLRARDGFRLMEDGTVGATKYIGHFAPSSITASYDLTWPAAASGSKKHLYSGSDNQLGWGQNVDTEGTPTFANITDSGLTASKPVFTNADKLLVSTGTVPIDQGGTGATTAAGAASALGVGTEDSPEFVTVDLSDLNTGYLPYQTDPGLANSVLFCAGNNLGMGMASFGDNADYVFALLNGTAPTTSPEDCFQMYSADSGGTPGKAGPHFRCEDGTVIDLQDIASGGATSFTDLDDVPASYVGDGGKVVKVKATEDGLEFVAGGAGVSSFNDLDDVPASYVGQAGLFPRVKATEDGLEYAAGGSGAPTDAEYVVETANGDLSAEVVLGTTVITDAVYASRQAAAKEGRLFFPTDGFYIERDTGSAWAPWGPIFPMTPVVSGDFAWINQGTATIDTTYGGVYLLAAAAGGDSLKIRKKSKAGTYSIVCCILPHLASANYASCGLLWRQSADGKLVTFGIHPSDSTLRVLKWTNETTYSNVYATPFTITNILSGPLWLKIQDEGTNRKCYWSTDGRHWLQIHSIGRTDFMTADEVGFFCNSNNATWSAGATFLSWEEGT